MSTKEFRRYQFDLMKRLIDLGYGRSTLVSLRRRSQKPAHAGSNL